MKNSTYLLKKMILFFVVGISFIFTYPFCSKSPNHPPQSVEIVPSTKNVEVGKDISISIPTVNDPDGDPVIFTWSANKGKVPSTPTTSAVITYTAPATAGQDVITVVVSDNKGGMVTATTILNIISRNEITTPSANPFKIKITTPKAMSMVEFNTGLIGEYEGEQPADKYVWIVINPHPSPGQWWPQGGRISPWQGRWHVQVVLGREVEDRGVKFDIAVILVNQEDDQYYYTYLENGEKTRKFPGIPLAPSAIIVDKVTVIRK